MTDTGDKVLAFLVVFVVSAVAALHFWDKYWDGRARAREGVL